MSLTFQPQDQIPNKTKGLTLVGKKEHPSIVRIVIHYHKDISFPTHWAHRSWTNQVHMEQLARTLYDGSGPGVDGRWLPSYHANTGHTSNPSGTSTCAIMRPSRAHSSDTTTQSSSDPVSYASFTNQSKHSQQGNEKNQSTGKNWLGKFDPQGRSCIQDRLENSTHMKHMPWNRPQNPHQEAGKPKANWNRASWQEQHAESHYHLPSWCPLKALDLVHCPRTWCTPFTSLAWGSRTTFDL
jgi:hypothetical protein